ncbi:hypothetical protein [Burkholderia gladioli]|uniref:hypothetical protein n=1 Tax=Burkholderia gladioli TaxID=28095 RepID=UPI00163E3419|nr:hypothetical protein [Burkholderia gladioli]
MKHLGGIMNKIVATILAASLCAASAAHAFPQVIPEETPVFLAGVITVGEGKFAYGHYTQIELITPEISPCTHKPVRQILLWNANIGDAMILAKYVDTKVVAQGIISCPNSGIQFSPDPQRVVPIF